MLVACWSVKGGSGTTVVAASLALVLARENREVVTFVDLAGDGPSVFGIAEPRGPGLADWSSAAHDVPAAALTGLTSPVRDGLRLLHRGVEPVAAQAGERVAVALAALGTVVVDCGQLVDDKTSEVAVAVAAGATHSLLVLRPCFLSLRAAIAAPIRPSGLVLSLDQPRALGRADIEEVLGVPVRAEVRWDPAVARAVDAGLLAIALPPMLSKALRAAA